MNRKAAASAIHLIRTGIAAKSSHEFGNSTPPFFFFRSKFHNFGQRGVPKIDSSSINDGEDAICLFHEMVKMRPQPSVIVYTKLLSIIVKMKHYSLALSVFDEMRRLDIPVNEYTFNVAINCYCLLNRVDLGLAILGIIFKSGYKPDCTTFGTLIKGHFLDRKVAEAEKLFKKLLVLKTCEPNDAMILTLINGLCKAGQTTRAFELLHILEKTRWKPDVRAYTSLIDGLCKSGMVDDALQLLSKMTNMGISPNVVTYNSIIQGSFRKGRYDDGCKLFNEMKDRGVHPDLLTYNVMLDALCKFGEISKAISFLQTMEDEGIIPDVVTYSTIIKGLCRAGDLEVARDIFNELPSRGLQPNVHIYTMIVGSLCQEGSVEEAKELVVKMEESGCAPNSGTYNVVIRSLSKRNEFMEAIPFLKEMRKKGFSADSATMSLLLDKGDLLQEAEYRVGMEEHEKDRAVD